MQTITCPNCDTEHELKTHYDRNESGRKPCMGGCGCILFWHSPDKSYNAEVTNTEA